MYKLVMNFFLSNQKSFSELHYEVRVWYVFIPLHQSYKLLHTIQLRSSVLNVNLYLSPMQAKEVVALLLIFAAAFLVFVPSRHIFLIIVLVVCTRENQRVVVTHSGCTCTVQMIRCNENKKKRWSKLENEATILPHFYLLTWPFNMSHFHLLTWPTNT